MNFKKLLKLTTLPLIFCSALVADTVVLKQGWNLIGVPSEKAASSLQTNTNILSATGGGVGGGGNFSYNKKYVNYAQGNFILGQGYWIKVDVDTVLEYNKVSNIPTKIELTTGWNLISPFSEVAASELIEYPEILSATGGGVGGGGNFSYNKKYVNYAQGTFIKGQGYWVKVSSPITMSFSDFNFRAWGIAGDDVNSQSSFRLNGVEYTLLVYSEGNIEQSNASSSGTNTIFMGDVFGKTITQIKISDDYSNQNVKLKLFQSDSVFDETTLVYQSDALIANSSYVTYPNITFETTNDYRPIEPSDANIEMPPSAPIF